MSVRVSHYIATDEDHAECVMQGLRNCGARVLSVNYNGIDRITIWTEHEPGLPDETVAKAIEAAIEQRIAEWADDEDEMGEKPVLHS